MTLRSGPASCASDTTPSVVYHPILIGRSLHLQDVANRSTIDEIIRTEAPARVTNQLALAHAQLGPRLQIVSMVVGTAVVTTMVAMVLVALLASMITATAARAAAPRAVLHPAESRLAM